MKAIKIILNLYKNGSLEENDAITLIEEIISNNKIYYPVYYGNYPNITWTSSEPSFTTSTK